MLEIKNLTHKLDKGIQLFNNLNLTIRPGSVYGLIGKNGSGKSTLFKQILGISTYDEGEIYFNGKPFYNTNADRRIFLHSVGSLIENPSIYDHLTGKQHLRMLCSIYNTPSKYIDQTLDLLKLSDVANRKARHYSLGTKQRLGIGMALVTQPRFVFLDEPLNGLDPEAIVDVRRLILDLNSRDGVTFLISSHILSEMELIASHIGILHNGYLVYDNVKNDIEVAGLSLEQIYRRYTIG